MSAQMLLQYFASSASANITGVALLATGVKGGSWAYVDESGNTVSRNSTYFNAHPVFGGIQDVMIDGQYMVKIPKFYYKRGLISGGVNNGKVAWWISDKPVDGFAVHPAFMDAGAQINQIYIGKYQASMDGSKLCSKPGVLPAVKTYAMNFKAAAVARNVSGITGFAMLDVYKQAAIQWLYLVENATMDSQTKTGIGRVGLQAVANVDASDVAQATYRGMVGLWGNISTIAEGLRISTYDHIVQIWKTDGTKLYASTGFVSTVYAANGSAYPTGFISVQGSGFAMDSVFFTDNNYKANEDIALAPDGQFVGSVDDYCQFGGSNPGAAGLWYLYGSYNTDSGDKDGTRLTKI